MIKKNYRANSLSEAVHRIKMEMGPKASIISTLSIPAKRTLFRFTPSQIEVVASVDEKYLTHEQLTGLQGQSDGLPEEKMDVAVRMGSAESEVQLQELRKKLKSIETENQELKKQLLLLVETQEEIKLVHRNLRVTDLEENLGLLFRQQLRRKLLEQGLSERLLSLWQKYLGAISGKSTREEITALSADFFRRQFVAFRGALSKQVAFLGPKLSGKTTTVMKLAYQLKAAGKNIALVSVDDQHTGEVNELEIFCEELGMPYADIRQMQNFEEYLAQHANCDHILIDTGSVESDDRLGIKRLQNWLAKAHSTNLVVLGGDNSDNALFMQTYRELPLHGFIFTKMDQDFGAGAIFNVIEEAGKPVYYYGTGQNLADDFEMASVDKLLARIFPPEGENQDLREAPVEENPQNREGRA